ncbi:ice-binding family protein [Dyadobacter tibetensis]|uniref:ice-binding family protein n=1 Tax=Dyadobacter tibetensis TaxID=1211851 RepID=UPI000472465A|nr:ice-binding family protein [Dyadobacter tibetensis]
MTKNLTFTFLLAFAMPLLTVGQTMPNLGTSASTFILYTPSGALDNVGNSVVVGDVGTNNVGGYSGFTPGTVLKGTAHINDRVSIDAGVELQAAYNNFATNTICGTTLPMLFAIPVTLTPDTYCTLGATAIMSDITLDGGGDPNAVFLFKIGGALSVLETSQIILTGGAQISNVYFQVDGAVDLATGSIFRGTIVADGAIELLGDAMLYGKALSTSGAIHLHNNRVASSEAALPVTLVSFNVIRNDNNTCTMSWATTEERNSDRFEIESSQNAIDWQSSGSVLAMGESVQRRTYSISTEIPGTGITYFRLKMIDKDETFSYSRIRQVEFSSNSRTAHFPNPVKDQLTLNISDMSKVKRIQLNDLNGRIIYDQSKGMGRELPGRVDLQNTPSGLYNVRVFNSDGTVINMKIVKQ